VGELANPDRLVVEGVVDTFDARLLDYAIRNAGPVRLRLDRQVVRVDRLQLVGDETQLTVGGSIDLANQQIALRASGDANLGILQGFLPNVRGSGRAVLQAAIDGPLYEPLFSGNANITGGRVRHLSLPNSLDTINGAIRFDSRSVTFDDLEATVGGGRVQFGGAVTFDGYLPGELNLTARGEGIQLRYPEGVRSTVDTDLTVRGNVKSPVLGGTVIVRNATWTRRIDPTAGLFDLGGGDRPSEEPAAESVLPLRFDLSVQVPSTLRIENNLARLVARADLQLRGTYDRPVLFGRAEVDRGEVTFEGRRYLVTRGAIEFTNPTRIEPFFDVEAETRVRVPGTPAQTYRVIVGAAGTMERLQPQLSSDPPLPAGEVLALLFSDVRRGQDVELRSLQNPNELETDILATRATQLLADPISSEVGRVVEQTFGVDTFQVRPSLIDPYSPASQRVNPSARVTIGKRISERVYLTFSRSVSTSINDQLLLLEYDESDRLSWVLSRNEDETYAVEVRVRHNF
jgi:autotransporter translocation and assembly factor TamB